MVVSSLSCFFSLLSLSSRLRYFTKLMVLLCSFLCRLLQCVMRSPTSCSSTPFSLSTMALVLQRQSDRMIFDCTRYPRTFLRLDSRWTLVEGRSQVGVTARLPVTTQLQWKRKSVLMSEMYSTCQFLILRAAIYELFFSRARTQRMVGSSPRLRLRSSLGLLIQGVVDFGSCLMMCQMRPMSNDFSPFTRSSMKRSQSTPMSLRLFLMVWMQLAKFSRQSSMLLGFLLMKQSLPSSFLTMWQSKTPLRQGSLKSYWFYSSVGQALRYFRTFICISRLTEGIAGLLSFFLLEPLDRRSLDLESELLAKDLFFWGVSTLTFLNLHRQMSLQLRSVLLGSSTGSSFCTSPQKALLSYSSSSFVFSRLVDFSWEWVAGLGVSLRGISTEEKLLLASRLAELLLYLISWQETDSLSGFLWDCWSSLFLMVLSQRMTLVSLGLFYRWKQLWMLLSRFQKALGWASGMKYSY